MRNSVMWNDWSKSIADFRHASLSSIRFDHIDWTGFRDAIRDTGYDGPVVIESFTAENETIATAASAPSSVCSSATAAVFAMR